MRQLYLVCVKCEHVNFMSEKPPALSLCFKLEIYMYFSLLSIWTLLKIPGQASLKKKRLVLCVLFLFWGKGCSLKTSLGFGGEAAAGS